MHWVNTMGFITHCWKKNGLELLSSLVRLLCVGILSISAAWAQNASIELTEDRRSQFQGRQTAWYQGRVPCLRLPRHHPHPGTRSREGLAGDLESAARSPRARA
jgi:hypothetical protein